MSYHTCGEELELHIYRILGVVRFRDCAFLLERWVHRKDANRNSNYHIRNYSLYGIKMHYALLSYNALIHMVCILLSVLMFAVLWMILPKIPAVFIFINLCTLVMNMYCIMLQRYNAIRIRGICRRLEEKRLRRVERDAWKLRHKMPRGEEALWLGRDLEWLGEMRARLQHYQDCIIRDEMIPAMRRLTKWARAAGLSSVRVQPSEVERQSGKDLRLYQKADLGAQWLQKRLRPDDGRLLQPLAIITTSGECEDSFSALFPNDEREEMIAVMDAFLLFHDENRSQRGTDALCGMENHETIA